MSFRPPVESRVLIAIFVVIVTIMGWYFGILPGWLITLIRWVF